MRLCVTGTTGAIGEAVVERLRAEPGVEVVPLARRAWDVRQPIPPAVSELILGSDAVLHIAADTRLSGPAAEIRAANVGSVERLTALLHGCAAPGLVYVSSAFVDSQPQGDATNVYEASKRDAEATVRSILPDAVIVRPSIVMGARDTGRLARFGGFYSFLRMFMKKMVPAIVGDPDARLDFVPVDDVADALVTATRERRALAGQIVTVTSGAASPSIGDLVATLRACAADYAGEDFPPIPIIDPDTYWRFHRPMMLPWLSSRQRRLLEYCEVFLPYFAVDHAFAGHTVPGATPPATTGPSLVEVFDRSVRFWLETTTPRIPRGTGLWRRAVPA